MKVENLIVSGLILMPFVLTAQIRQLEVVPLKPWAAPPYWQLSQPERDAIVARLDAVGALTPHAEAPANSLVFVGMTPCRVADTRPGQGFSGAFGPPGLTAGASRTFPIQSSTMCTIPSIAQAYSFNITVVPSTASGFIAAYPTGQPLPLAATLVWSQGSVTSNAAVVLGGTSGSIDVYANSATDIVIDINGYYAAAPGSYTVNAFRNLIVGETVTLTPMCNNGDVVIGGYTQTFGTTGLNGDQRFAQIAPIGPVPAAQGWTATATGNTAAPDFLNVYAVCLHTPY